MSDERDLHDELAVALELDGEAVEDALTRALDLAYTYTCEVGSTKDNRIKKPGAYAMRWSGHFDPGLISTQILELLVTRRLERLREVTDE